MSKPVIVFVGSVYPGQLGGLCDHLRQTGMAETYFLTTPGHRNRHLVANPDRADHVLAFRPDRIEDERDGYYYTRKLEHSARLGRGILKALQAFEAKRKIDVVVSHSLWGAPHFLYDEIDAAIVSYIEFPSYQAHGWDPDYPPDLSQRMSDKNTEMLNLHQAIRSDLVICPSHHAKRMFPPALQGNIEVQMEGFTFGEDPVSDAVPNAVSDAPSDGPRPLTIGFSARGLSNAKGFDIYVRLVDQLIARGLKAEFVALGSAEGASYGYERQWVARHYKGAVASFRDHVLRRHPRAAEAIRLPGKLPYDEFAATLRQIDIFLYPLRFGAANWGLVEIMGRGGCVLAPNRDYAAEVIQDDISGRLLPDDDAAWIDEILALADDPARRRRYGMNARALARLQYSMASVAPRYMRLFTQAMDRRRARIG